jgi:uncharacterized DUF497 family protein
MPRYEYDPGKRQKNLETHGYDLEDARRIYEHPNVVTVRSSYAGEVRYIDLAPWGDKLLMLVYTMRGSVVRPISLRVAGRKERRLYEEKYPRS